MIVELQRSRQFDDSIWVPPDKDLTIMEENLNSLVDMEGYLEVKTAKMLTPNKKYWFVLSQSCLDYYENKYVKLQGRAVLIKFLIFLLQNLDKILLQGSQSKGQRHSGQCCHRKSS